MKPIVRRFESADEAVSFPRGGFEKITLAGMTVGRATYEPGWKWSEHVGPMVGATSCAVEHVGLVLAGRAAIRMDDGTEIVVSAGDLFWVPAGHDSWVVGDEPYVSIHLLGAGAYAEKENP